MNCLQFRQLVQDLARNEGLDVTTLNAALEHADSCSACDSLLEEAEALTADLHALAALDSSRQASARVEAAVQSAFAQHKSSALRAASVRLAAIAALTSIAALALFAVFLMRRPKPAPVPSANSRVGREEAALSVSGSLPGDFPSDALAPFEEGSAAGSFVPLTETFDRTSLEGSAVVRVVVSRDSLQNFGLAAGRRTEGQVLADMVVAGDGTPQAIRLVGR